MKYKVNSTMFTAFCSIVKKRYKNGGFRAAQGYVNDYLERHELSDEQEKTLNRILEDIKP